jgi:hypothetical protein
VGCLLDEHQHVPSQGASEARLSGSSAGVGGKSVLEGLGAGSTRWHARCNIYLVG